MVVGLGLVGVRLRWWLGSVGGGLGWWLRLGLGSVLVVVGIGVEVGFGGGWDWGWGGFGWRFGLVFFRVGLVGVVAGCGCGGAWVELLLAEKALVKKSRCLKQSMLL